MFWSFLNMHFKIQMLSQVMKTLIEQPVTRPLVKEKISWVILLNRKIFTKIQTYY